MPAFLNEGAFAEFWYSAKTRLNPECRRHSPINFVTSIALTCRPPYGDVDVCTLLLSHWLFQRVTRHADDYLFFCEWCPCSTLHVTCHPIWLPGLPRYVAVPFHALLCSGRCVCWMYAWRTTSQSVWAECGIWRAPIWDHRGREGGQEGLSWYT